LRSGSGGCLLRGAKYEVDDGFILVGGNKASVWWEDLVRVKEGRGLLVGIWFDDNVSRVLGDGKRSLFWKDVWLVCWGSLKELVRLDNIALVQQEANQLMK
jgi:hypothetical protein